MRLWHVLFAVAAASVVMALCRDPVGRVFVVVTATGFGEFVIGLAAVLALFQTVGAFGEAQTLPDHAEALAATTVVLGLATAAMSAWLFAGIWLVLAVTR